jgi:gliding motility-associated-like protein
MRIQFLFIFLLFGLTCYAQPADCDDRQVYASLQVIHTDCDSTVMEAFPNGSSALQWYVNGAAVAGETRRIFRYLGAADAFQIGVEATNGTFCNYTAYLIDIAGGCPVEDCSNGIDDDGNGLIDLNDSEGCDCGLPPEVVSRNLFPNPGFESRRDLPECQGCYASGQAFPCVSGWIPGNSITTLEHLLRCYVTTIPSRFIPYVTAGSNFSLIGGFAAYDDLGFTTQESAVVPLTEPTIPGERYRLIFETDFVNGSIFNLRSGVQGDIFQYMAWYTSPVLDSFPYRYDILTGEVVFGGSWDNWTVLDSVVIEVNDDLSLEQFVVEFTAPPEPINAMAFASARDQLRRRQLLEDVMDYDMYWVLDNVQLQRIRPPAVLAAEIDANVTTSTVVDSGSSNDCVAALLLSVPNVSGNSYQWYQDGIAVIGAIQSTYQIPVAEADGSLFQVRILRDGTCKTSDPVAARIPEPFEINFTVDSLLCGTDESGKITLEVIPTDAIFTVRWSDAFGENLGSGPQIEGLASGRYSLTITDEFGCTYPYTFDLTAPPALVAQLVATDLDCNASDGQAPLDLIVTGGTPPYEYYYEDETEPADRPLRRPAGNYQVRIVDAIGCEVITERVTVNEPNPFRLMVSSTSTNFFLGESANVRTTSNRELTNATIRWTPEEWVSCQGCRSPTLRPTENGILRVLITDSDGCARSDSIDLRVIPDRPIYFPNAISPNGDGINDVFRAYAGRSVDAVIKLEVFDRWGNLVFGGNRGNSNWAPTKTTPEGVFVYQANVRFIDGKIKRFSGAVTVLR